MAGTRNYQSIGEVLVNVKTEFPDITISKIRFLESEGLITPERTPSGYRKFYPDDVERLKSILTNPDRPVQFVIAGKSHPADDEGKRLIQQLVQFAQQPKLRDRIVFLPDYDMGMAELLYPGCDVWLNNPLRPYEACGTSGMKAALNGGLNLSILDGWWDEWYDGSNGWAIPSADGVRSGVIKPSDSRKRIFEIVMSGNSVLTATRTSPIDW